MYVNWHKVNQDNRVACQGGGRRCGGCVWIFPTLVFATTMSTLLWVGKPVVVVPLLCSMYIHRPSLNKLATIMWSSRRKLPTAQHRAEVELRQAGGVFSCPQSPLAQTDGTLEAPPRNLTPHKRDAQPSITPPAAQNEALRKQLFLPEPSFSSKKKYTLYPSRSQPSKSHRVVSSIVSSNVTASTEQMLFIRYSVDTNVQPASSSVFLSSPDWKGLSTPTFRSTGAIFCNVKSVKMANIHLEVVQH